MTLGTTAGLYSATIWCLIQEPVSSFLLSQKCVSQCVSGILKKRWCTHLGWCCLVVALLGSVGNFQQVELRAPSAAPVRVCKSFDQDGMFESLFNWSCDQARNKMFTSVLAHKKLNYQIHQQSTKMKASSNHRNTVSLGCVTSQLECVQQFTLFDGWKWKTPIIPSSLVC